MAASSSSAQDLSAVLIPLKPSPASRRLPPPCWSHDETVALIDAYCDKWYSLRRGNLRASHWQEVADDVGSRCPVSSGLPKTSVQCRHKMEKLRKRYRTELQRSLATPSGHRFSSSWVHFKRMYAMERGPAAGPAADSSPIGHDPDDEDNEDDDDDDDDDEALYQSVKRGGPHNPSVYGSMSNGIGGGSAFRIKIPGRPSVAMPPATSMYGKFDGKPYPNVDPSPNFVSTRVVKDEYSGRSRLGKRGGGDRVGKKREGDPVGEMVAAIKALGDGFVRMEKMKMEMAREVEAMRVEMEMKRTEMILESQQRIVEAFANAFSEKRSKKAKRMPTPES